MLCAIDARGLSPGTRRPSLLQSAIIPGVFAGLATGSKYTLFVLIVPVLVAIVFYLPGMRRLWAALAACAAMVAAFLLAVPYSVLALTVFLDGVAFDAMHYAQGHIGFDGDPGWPQLVFYGRHFVSEFGFIGIVATVLGIAAAFKADWRRTTVLLSFPVMLLTLLSSQRVHFTRNVLSLHPVVALFLAYGLVSVYRGTSHFAATRGHQWRYLKPVWLAAGLVMLATAAVPLWHSRQNLRIQTDSRNIAQQWIADRTRRTGPSSLRPSWLSIRVRLRAAESASHKSISNRFETPIRSSGSWKAFNSRPFCCAALGRRFPICWTGPCRQLNEVDSHVHVVTTFGSNPVLVNYPPPTAWGDRRLRPPCSVQSRRVR